MCCVFLLSLCISLSLLCGIYAQSLTIPTPQIITLAASFGSGPNACCLQGELGARLAVSEISKSNFFPNGTKFNMDLFYDGADPSVGVKQFIKAIANRSAQTDTNRYVSVMFGQTSTVAQAQSYVAEAHGIPQVSWGALASFLAPTSLYPGFVRTGSPLGKIAGMWIALCKRMGWKRVATITEAQPIYGDIMVDFQAKAISAGIQVVAAETFASTASPRVPVLNVKASGATIIFYLAYATQYRRVMIEAYKAGLMQKGYQWFSHQSNAGDNFWSGLSDIQLPELGAVSKDQLNEMDRILFESSKYMISGQMSLGQPDNKEYQSFVTRFKQAYPTEVIVNWAAIVYDTTMFIAHACRNVMNLGQELTYTNLMKQYRNMSIVGTTGTVAIEKGNNDRSGLPFNVWNFLPIVGCDAPDLPNCWKWQLVAYYDDVANTVLDFTGTGPTTMTFMGNTKTPPTDTKPLIPIERKQIHTVYNALTVLGLVFCVVIILWCTYLREDRLVKASSPLFDCLSVVGCMLALVYNFLESDTPSNLSCMAQVWCLAVGITMFIACLFTKTFRISRVFRVANKLTASTRITNLELVASVVVFVCVDVALLAAWTAVDPLSPHFNSNTEQSWIVCASNNNTYPVLFGLLLVVWKVVLLAAASIVSINVNGVITGLRHAHEQKYGDSNRAVAIGTAGRSACASAPASNSGSLESPTRERRSTATRRDRDEQGQGFQYDMFNDYRSIGATLYNLLFVVVLGLILVTTQEYSSRSSAILRPLIVLAATIPSIAILFLPKLVKASLARLHVCLVDSTTRSVAGSELVSGSHNIKSNTSEPHQSRKNSVAQAPDNAKRPVNRRASTSAMLETSARASIDIQIDKPSSLSPSLPTPVHLPHPISLRADSEASLGDVYLHTNDTPMTNERQQQEQEQGQHLEIQKHPVTNKNFV